jgi:hypothetical protein
MQKPSFKDFLGTFDNTLQKFCQTDASQDSSTGPHKQEFHEQQNSLCQQTGLTEDFQILCFTQTCPWYQSFQLEMRATRDTITQSQLEKAADMCRGLYAEACLWNRDSLRPRTDTLCMLESSECHTLQHPKPTAKFFLHFTTDHVVVLRISHAHTCLNKQNKFVLHVSVDKVHRQCPELFDPIFRANATKKLSILAISPNFRSFPTLEWTPIPYLQDRMFAFAMGGHRRLGEKSQTSKFPTDLVNVITKRYPIPVDTHYLLQFADAWQLDGEGGSKALQRYHKVQSYPASTDTAGSIPSSHMSCAKCGCPLRP